MVNNKLDDNDSSLKLPGANPPVEIAAPEDDHQQNWLMLALLGLAALALAVLIVLAARWAANRSASSNAGTTSRSTSGLPKPPPVNLKPGQ